MSFFKSLGSLAGGIAGFVVGGTVQIVGEVTGSEFIKDIGTGVQKASEKSGELLGSIVDGTVNVALGVVTQDDALFRKGDEEFSKAAGETLTRIGNGIAYTATKGINTVGAVFDGDYDKAVANGKDLLKVVAIGTLAVGVVDFLDGPDGMVDIDGDDNYAVESSDLIENPNTHSVEPHYRTYADGSKVWVDGDGNTGIDRDTGWVQDNPDYRK